MGAGASRPLAPPQLQHSPTRLPVVRRGGGGGARAGAASGQGSLAPTSRAPGSAAQPAAPKVHSGEGREDPEVAAMLAALARPPSSFPPDFAQAIEAGRVSPELLQRYLDLEAKFVIGWLMGIQGFRERFLADPSFLVKLGIEVGIGICTKMTAEYTKRQGTFFKELDFVAANVTMALIADFMLVWLPAPTLALVQKQAAKLDILGRAFAGCPDNAFQKVQPGMQPFTLAQRLGAPVRNGLKLFGVGLGASFVGVALTNTLITLRQLLDPDFVPLNPPQNVLVMSALYGLYMATSSNLRYQILAGLVEERGIETLFKGNYRLCAVLSFVMRTSNTFIGSLWWVDFIRFFGLQTGGGH